MKKAAQQEHEGEEVKITDAPDGGYGWLVVLSGFLFTFTLIGMQYSYGIYLSHYLDNDFKNRATKAELSLVGTISTSLLAMGGIFSGTLADRFGYRAMCAVGSLTYAIGLLLASFATEVWHLYVAQGVVVGLGSSIVFFPVISVPGQWFTKKRGLATGICTAGTGLGGLVWAPVTQGLLHRIGLPWTLRVSGVTVLFVGLCASFLLRERVPSQPTDRLPNLSRFADTRFILLWGAGFVSNLGYLVPFFVTPLFAQSIKLTADQGAILLGLLNASNALGRIVMGVLGDRLGSINVMGLGVFLAGVSCLLVWPFASSFALLLCFCVSYGLCAGSLISLLPVVSSEVFGMEGIASTNGLLFLSTGVASLIGVPISVALIGISIDLPPYLPVILFSGLASLVGSLFILLLKLK